MIRKEYGSDFHYHLKEDILLERKTNSLFYGDAFSLFFSGRAALYALIAEGINTSNWKKIYLPSYYCHEVTLFIKPLPIEIIYYENNPFLDVDSKALPIEDIKTNVIVNVMFFGLKKLDCNHFKNAVVIEDVSHHILGFQHSTADYCFGSLRKELPLPVGGFCFSPKQLPLPRATTNSRSEKVAIQKLTAMHLKEEYLNGIRSDKEEFRKLFAGAESDFEEDYTRASMPESVKDLLYQIDIDKILVAKYDNLKIAITALKDIPRIIINFESTQTDAFGLILICETTEQRDGLKSHLIANQIFPAVLWPSQFNERDKEIEGKMLFVHVDYRYDAEDIKVITYTIKSFFLK